MFTEFAWLCKPSLLARLIISGLLTFKLFSLNSIIEVFFIKVSTPKEIEMAINNIPGVLENGLFVDLTDKVLVGKIDNNIPVVYSPSKVG